MGFALTGTTKGLWETTRARYVRPAARIIPPALMYIAVAAWLAGADLRTAGAVALAGIISRTPVIMKTLRTGSPDLVGGWLLALTGVLAVLAFDPETTELAAVAAVGLLALTGVIARRMWMSVVAVSTVVVESLAWLAHGANRDDVWVLITVVAASGGVAWLARSYRSLAAGSEEVVRVLSDERASLIRLYEVATSIGASSSRSEALPDLLDTIAHAVGVRICAIALTNETRTTLTLAGPVWINGAHIPVEDELSVRVPAGGFGSSALRSLRAIRFERSTAGDLGPLLADLGLESGFVAALRLEGRETGLLIVGDPIHDREEALVAELTAFAGPASLVLAQLERHEAAALLTRRLQEIADMKSDFVSMVSHELRTPLTSVLGALDTLSRPALTPDNPAAVELLSAARRQATRLKRLIDDLLTVSRIDKGVLRPNLGSVDLGRVASEASQIVGESRVAVSVPAGLRAEADTDYLTQVLTNLIENAIKYGDGSPVEVTASDIGSGELAITVVDHGPGIPAECRDEVFERFARLDSTAHVGGTGLGLSIVKMLVEGMNGRVGVTDTPGGGATFVVILDASMALDSTLKPAYAEAS